MSLHEVEQRLKSEIEVEIAAIKAAGHNTGTNALVALVERMWAYFHGDHVERALADVKSEVSDLSDHVVQSVGTRLMELDERVSAIENKPELVLTDEQKALISETPRPIADLKLTDEQKAVILRPENIS